MRAVETVFPENGLDAGNALEGTGKTFCNQ